jgi:hypothetical protein
MSIRASSAKQHAGPADRFPQGCGQKDRALRCPCSAGTYPACAARLARGPFDPQRISQKSCQQALATAPLAAARSTASKRGGEPATAPITRISSERSPSQSLRLWLQSGLCTPMAIFKIHLKIGGLQPCFSTFTIESPKQLSA